MTVRQAPYWQEFLHKDGKGNPGKCAQQYVALAHAIGSSQLHKILIAKWSSFSEQTKANFCYTAADANAMYTLTALALFSHPASGTHERHLLVAGLAASAEARQTQLLVLGLLNQIGTYADARKQASLDRFLSNARRQFERAGSPVPIENHAIEGSAEEQEKTKARLARRNQEQTLWSRYSKTHSYSARNNLWLHYQPLVRYIAERLKSKLPDVIGLKDMMSAGNIGLLDAINKFDPKMDTRFETYCVPRVRGSILDFIRSLDWVPRLIRNKTLQYERVVRELAAELRREPYDDEIAARLNMNLGQLNELKSELDVKSKSSSEDQDQSSVALLESHTVVEPTRELQRDEIRKLALQGLNSKERMVVEQYYFEGRSMKQIGTELRLSESKICKIHAEVLALLRKKFKAYQDSCFISLS